ncbi:MAG: DegT/DnrJ/EryC1/StrS family aminotransferase [Acidobacteriota bacterium]|nr:DegT/DnrJ/EryC1/StrS family aminotransferase [Acidobacteriota bacterium]
MQFLDLQRQYASYREEIDARMRRVLEHTRFVMGPEIEELEQLLASRIGVAHAVTTASGTSGLELSLRALEIGPGDEVIAPTLTFVASAEVVRLVGATPVFVDIQHHSFNIDPTAFDAAVTDRTKAVIAVDLYGQMADYEQLNKLAAVHQITVIEDAAQSFGATQNGLSSGAATDIGTTSFFPTKTLSCFGDGGALFTNDDAVAERVRALRTHGGQGFDHQHIGTNARFDTIQAAVLLAKLPHFDEEILMRQRLAARYSEALGDVCQVPSVAPGNTHVFTPYTVRLNNRDQVCALLRERGIPVAIYYPRCLHEQPAYAAYATSKNFPEGELASREVISLPLYPFLTVSEQDRVIRGFRDVIAEVNNNRGSSVDRP